MKVLIAGASGMIGTEVASQLAASGHEVLRLVRGTPKAANEYNWAPSARIIDFTLMDRVDAVVNLSGASLSRLPWTPAWKRTILASRLEATHTLTDAMRMAASPPAVFLSGSAVGFYGDRPGQKLTETAIRGTGFLADVVEAWESAAHLAPEKTRVVTLRTGVVIGRGGAMKPLLPAGKLGLLGPIAGGGQHWPWVSLHDEAAAIVHLLGSTLRGPVNIAGPTPATADTVLRSLAAALRRPYGLPLPEKAITLALGDAGRELLLASQKVVPQKLLDDGFVFSTPTVRDAMDRLVAKR
ncbi:nucleoside-diphosphate sugar epimerase [Leifsonia sp. Root227]|uniref:TIGR01777 family oxidoreductase n=1 Tax=Leifsonia sp. Root227 TaxID=1736496 RepID=UPI0006F36561|nr:TIGR01777 family oxidoreductase [Leifsonia sp. Root227]KRC49731.1 nucleoside-diphosphate sugar epimerase [Leifsonia sp. Root227]